MIKKPFLILLLVLVVIAVAVLLFLRFYHPRPMDGPGEIDPNFSDPPATALPDDDNDWKAKLNGAWEQPGVIGTRIEIDGDHLLILWMNRPVLETTFTLTVKDSREAALEPQNSGLRNAGDSKDYAAVTSLIYRDGALVFTKDFPISGVSEETLQKTDNSRYGNYDIADEVLEELQGTWKEEGGYFTLTFKGDAMTLNDFKTKVHVLKNKNDTADNPTYLIADQDPAVTEFRGITRPEYHDGVLTAYMIVYDADSVLLTFVKQ